MPSEYYNKFKAFQAKPLVSGAGVTSVPNLAGSYTGGYKPKQILDDSVMADLDILSGSSDIRNSVAPKVSEVSVLEDSQTGPTNNPGLLGMAYQIGQKVYNSYGQSRDARNEKLANEAGMESLLYGDKGAQRSYYTQKVESLDKSIAELTDQISSVKGFDPMGVRGTTQKEVELTAKKKALNEERRSYMNQIYGTYDNLPDWFNKLGENGKRRIVDYLGVGENTYSLGEAGMNRENVDYYSFPEPTFENRGAYYNAAYALASELGISGDEAIKMVYDLGGSTMSNPYFNSFRKTHLDRVIEFFSSGKDMLYTSMPEDVGSVAEANWMTNTIRKAENSVDNLAPFLYNNIVNPIVPQGEVNLTPMSLKVIADLLNVDIDAEVDLRESVASFAYSNTGLPLSIFKASPTFGRVVSDVFGLDGINTWSRGMIDKIDDAMEGTNLATSRNTNRYISGLFGSVSSSILLSMASGGTSLGGAAVTTAFGSATAADFYNQMRDKEYGTGEAALVAISSGAAVSALEYIGWQEVFSTSSGRSALRHAISGMGFEGITEGLQEMTENTVSRIFTDRYADLWDNVPMSFAMGAFAGGVTTGALSFLQPQIEEAIMVEARQSLDEDFDLGDNDEGADEKKRRDELISKEASELASRIVRNVENNMNVLQQETRRSLSNGLDAMRQTFKPADNPNIPAQPEYNNEYFDEVQNVSESINDASMVQLEGETLDQYVDRVMNSTNIDRLWEMGKGDRQGAYENIIKAVESNSKNMAEFFLKNEDTISDIVPDRIEFKNGVAPETGTYKASELFDSPLFSQEESLKDVNIEITDNPISRFDPETETIYIQKLPRGTEDLMNSLIAHELQHYHDVVNLGMAPVDGSFTSLATPQERRGYVSMFVSALGKGVSPERLRSLASRLDSQALKELPTGHQTVEGYLDEALSYIERSTTGEKLQVDEKELAQALSVLNTDLIKDIAVNFSMEGGKQGVADFQNNTITLFKGAIESGNFTRTTIHEYWHLLGRYLSDSDVASVKKQYESDKEKYTKENPGWENKVNAQNYRYTSMEEYFAEMMTDETMQRVVELNAKPRSIIGYAKAVFNRIINSLSPSLRSKIFNKLKAEKNLSIQRMNRMDAGMTAEMREFAKTEKRWAQIYDTFDGYLQEHLLKDSVVKDLVYHGSGKSFEKFNYDFIGQSGTSEGYGFYFTSDKSVAESYYKDGGKIFEVYLDIKKPLGYTSKKMSIKDIKNFMRELDPVGDDLLSNYGDVNMMGYDAVLDSAAKQEYEYNDNDVDIVSGITNIAGRDYSRILPALIDSTGYDGIVVSEPDWAKGQVIYLAFSDDQIIEKSKAEQVYNEAQTADMPSFEGLDSIKNKYSGIDLIVSESDGDITLSKIVVPKEGRGRGIGTSVMNDLTGYADRTGQRILLTPTKDFGGAVGRLKDFYKRFDFIENKGRNRDFSTREQFIRDPQQTAEMPAFEDYSDEQMREYEESVLRDIEGETAKEMGGEFIQKEAEALVNILKGMRGSRETKISNLENVTQDIDQFRNYLLQNNMTQEAQSLRYLEERVDEMNNLGYQMDIQDVWSDIVSKAIETYSGTKQTRESILTVNPKNFKTKEEFMTALKNKLRENVLKGEMQKEVKAAIGQIKELDVYKRGDVAEVRKAITEYARGVREGGVVTSRNEYTAKKSLVSSIQELISSKDMQELGKGQLNKLLRAVRDVRTQDQMTKALETVSGVSEDIKKKVLIGTVKNELGKYKAKKAEAGKTSPEYEFLRNGMNQIYFDGNTLRTREENKLLLNELQKSSEDYSQRSTVDYQDFVTYALLSESTKGLEDMTVGELETVITRIKDTRSLARDSFILGQIDRAADLTNKTIQSVQNMWSKHATERTPENRKKMQDFLFNFLKTIDIHDRGFAQIINLLDSIQGGRFFRDIIYQPIAEGNKNFSVKDDKYKEKDRLFLEELFKTKGAKVTGQMSGLDRKIKKLGEQMFVGKFESEDGKVVRLWLTPGQMADIWISSQMESNNKAMREDGIYIGGAVKAENRIVKLTDEILSEIEKKMPAEQLEMAKYVIKGVHDQELTSEMVKAYEDKYNKPFPFVKGGYWMLNRRYMGTNQRGDDIFNPAFEGKSIPSPSSFNERVSNHNPVLVTDAWSKYLNWRNDILRFTSYDKALVNAKAVITNKDFKSEFIEKFGSKNYRHLVNSFEYTAKNGNRYDDPSAKAINWVRSALSVSFIGGKTRNIFSQGSSAVAALADMPISDFSKYFAKTLTSPREAYNKMMESPLVKYRHQQAGFTRGMFEAEARAVPQYGKSMFNHAMYFTKVGDMLGVTGAGYTVYQYRYDQYSSQGMTKEDADKYAMQDAENFIISTQQSSLPEYANYIMQSHPALRTAGSFQQAQSMYRARGWEAMNEWINKGEARWNKENFGNMARKVFTYHFYLPAMYDISRGNINPFAIAANSVMSPISGFMGYGTYVDWGLRMGFLTVMFSILGLDTDDLEKLLPFEPSHLIGEARDIYSRTVNSVVDMIEGGANEKDYVQVFGTLGLPLGVPVKNLTEEIKRGKDFFTGKNTDALRILETEWQNNQRIEGKFADLTKEGKYEEAKQYYLDQKSKGYFDGMPTFKDESEKKSYMKKLEKTIDTKIRNEIKDQYGIELITFDIPNGLSDSERDEKQRKIDNSVEAIKNMPQDAFDALVKLSSASTAKGLRKARKSK